MLSCRVGKKIVYALGEKNKETLRKWSDNGKLKCPVCNEELVFRAGKIKTWHFAHKVDSNCESKNFEPETDEHYRGKKLLYIWFKKQPNIKSVELEKWLPDIKLRPDVFVVDEEGREYCIEYQCSPIKQEQKDYKSELYEMNNMIPVWVFGTERIGKNSKVASIYRLNSEKKLFIKKAFKAKVNKRNDKIFYFDNGNFYLQDEVDNKFKRLFSEFWEKYKFEFLREELENKKRHAELLSNQKLLYLRVMDEIKRDREKSKKQERINKIISMLNFKEDKTKLEYFEKSFGDIYKWINFCKKHKLVRFTFVIGKPSDSKELEFVHNKIGFNFRKWQEFYDDKNFHIDKIVNRFNNIYIEMSNDRQGLEKLFIDIMENYICRHTLTVPYLTVVYVDENQVFFARNDN